MYYRGVPPASCWTDVRSLSVSCARVATAFLPMHNPSYVGGAAAQSQVAGQMWL